MPGRAKDADLFPLCVSGSFPRVHDLPSVPAGTDVEDLPVRIDADTAEANRQALILTGKAVLERGDQRLTADRLYLDRDTNIATATGEVRLDAPDLTAFGSKAVLEIDADRGDVDDVDYYFHPRHGQGASKHLEIRGGEWARLRDVSYSTCDPGNEFWKLEAGDLELDKESGQGIAKNAVLRLGNVPVFYLPYMKFPIDDRRQTGFLVPRIGDSSLNGFDLTVPWYWNIAPHRDATLFPRYMSDRGLMLGGEFRYLNPNNQGELFGSYLPNDDKFGEDRWAISYRHTHSLAPRWSARINYSKVSDTSYLKEFSDNLYSFSATHLDQSADLAYDADRWTAGLRVQEYQTVDESIRPANRPYKRLPEFRFAGEWPGEFDRPTYRFDGQVSNFKHQANVEGLRADILPGVSFPLRRPWGYFVPKISLSHTAYNLDGNPDGSDNLTRTAPIVSVDTGLVFERDLNWQSGTFLQTLEPRLFYVYIPNRDQDDIPLFDTANLSVNYNALFRENRFVGRDRLGDANQVTTAISSRILDQGFERFRFSVGQIQYFRDREVTLNPRDAPGTRKRSDLVSEARFFLRNGFSMTGTLQWDTKESTSRLSRLDLRYNAGPGRVLVATHRYERDVLQQVDLRGIWPVSPQWRVMGRMWYSVDADRLLEGIAGVEYRDCCWALRLAARRFRNGSGQAKADTSVYAEIELLGLAGIGTGLSNVLSDAIPGYDAYQSSQR